MAFTSLTNTTSFNNLPILIAGPILRQVDSNDMTVKIVTKKAVNVELKAYQYADSHDPVTGVVHMSGTSSSKKIGKNLYITYITADHATNQFVAGGHYKYNIVFTSESNKALLDSDISGSVNFADYLYDGQPLPNFVKSPSNFADLKIVHASCRKPHGEWTDCMFAIDKIIKKAIDDNDITERSNYLFLTGDQIYADDVSDQLLFFIRDAAKQFVDFNETVDISDLKNELSLIKSNLEEGKIIDTSGVNFNFDTAYSNLGLESNDNLVLNNLIPGIRGPYIHASHLTVDPKFEDRHVNIAKSHLMALQEFFMMYVFVWSEVLWPDFANFPTFNEVVTRPDAAAGLISTDRLKEIKENNIDNVVGGEKVVMIVSPAPVLGHELLEPLLKDAFFWGAENQFIAQNLDYEAWDYNRNSKEYLLNMVKRFEQVIFFSGDVHYGSSIKRKYWDDNDVNNKESYSFPQLTSTSLKNRTFMTGLMKLLPTPSQFHMKWNSDGNHIRNADIMTWLQLGDTGSLPELKNVEWNKQPEQYPYVFDAVETTFSNIRNLTWDGAAHMAGEAWDDFVSFLQNPLKTAKEKYEAIKEFYQNIESVVKWSLSVYNQLNQIAGYLDVNIDQIREDWAVISQNVQVIIDRPTLLLNSTNASHWTQEKYDTPAANYTFIYEQYSNLDEYWDKIVNFLTTPPEIELRTPINLFFVLDTKPPIYYTTETVDDTRKDRLDKAIYTNLDTLLDFEEISSPIVTEDLKFQKLSIWGHIKWGGFVSSKVIGTNNMCEVTFPTWDSTTKEVRQRFWVDVLKFKYQDTDVGYLPVQPDPVNSPSYQKFLKPWTEHTINLNDPTEEDKPFVIRFF